MRFIHEFYKRDQIEAINAAEYLHTYNGDLIDDPYKYYREGTINFYSRKVVLGSLLINKHMKISTNKDE